MASPIGQQDVDAVLEILNAPENSTGLTPDEIVKCVPILDEQQRRIRGSIHAILGSLQEGGKVTSVLDSGASHMPRRYRYKIAPVAQQ